GVCAGLANLRLGSNAIDIMEHWIFYEPTIEGLQRALREIHGEFKVLTPSFFEHAEGQLLSNRLLQLALAKARTFGAEERIGLQQALHKAKSSLAELEHPAYVRLRAALREALTPDIPREESMWLERVACDCLLLVHSEPVFN